MRGLEGVFKIALVVAAWCAANAASGQTAEVEPNNFCEAAQEVAIAAPLPWAVAGRLEVDPTAEPAGDVDFYLFSYTPGQPLSARMFPAANSEGVVSDPFLGLFDSTCNLLAANDDYFGLNSRLDFIVPDDGLFILAATGCCDGTFEGWHGQEGTYVLRVIEPPLPIHSISGRVVDAQSGDPLPGDDLPWSLVELYRCTLEGCGLLINQGYADSGGRFSFRADTYGAPIEPGTFLLRAGASDYEPASTEPFDVGAGVPFDVGDLEVQPPALTFGEVTPCADIPPAGGSCWYSVDVHNNTVKALRGLGWSIVAAWGGTSPWGYTVFTAEKTRQVRIPARSSAELRFRFDVPENVSEGTTMCADVWFSDRMNSYFGTLRTEPLFCVMKLADGVQLVSPKYARARLGADRSGQWPFKPARP